MQQQGAPWLLVDLSNACRDSQLTGPGLEASWGGYERLIDVLSRSDIDYCDVFAVADRSLRHKLDAAGVKSLRRMQREGRLEISELADERILDYAYNPESRFVDALVLSQDRFLDFRRRYPEIQGSKDRFVGWNVSRNGELRVFLRDMGVATHATMSRKEEGGELKARRLRRADVLRRATSNFYKCRNPACIVAKFWPDHLRELPKYDDRRDLFICPSCGADLKEAGCRTPAAQLIVYFRGDERLRILLEHNQSVTVGRTDAAGCIGLERYLPQGGAASISRRHLQFQFDGTVSVTDLMSKNGTGRKTKRDKGRQPLTGGCPAELRRGDVLLLPGDVTVELSGRLEPFASDDHRPISQEAADAETTKPSGRG